MTLLNQYKKIAIKAAKAAGIYLLKNFYRNHRDRATLKFKHEIATQADLGAEKIILNTIKKEFPDHQILSEEAGKNHKKSDFFWVIDPLDGTTNYSMQNPIFNVSIGLFYKKEIVLGVVYAPLLRELYVTEKDKGTTLNGRKIHVSKTSNFHKSLLTFCHGHREKDIRRAIKAYNFFKLKGFDTRQLGSAALEMAFVAAGRTESIMIPGAHPWDVAAGTFLVREAGGKVTDFQGNDWSLTSRDMLASNGRIHKRLLKFLRNV
jgi:myo-inositol-1(or 4)-monophosphatase